jgi:hypothetical protein
MSLLVIKRENYSFFYHNQTRIGDVVAKRRSKTWLWRESSSSQVVELANRENVNNQCLISSVVDDAFLGFLYPIPISRTPETLLMAAC